MENKHLFAVYVDIPLAAAIQELVRLQSEALWTRIVKVLRLRAQEHVVLFNKEQHVELKLTEATFAAKNTVQGVVVAVNNFVKLRPTITLLQGIPKKSVFEEIIYNAAQLGVETIVPIKTAKSIVGEFSPKERERFESIMIAACEQAKQFVVPRIANQMNLQAALVNINPGAMKIVFDSAGQSCIDVVPASVASEDVVVLFGSEAGLTDQELSQAVACGFAKVRLTPTILRSEDAPLLGIGMLRSFIA